MAFYIKVVNGNVTQVWDTPPPAGEEGWREAIEVKPPIDGATQYYGTHYFDLTKYPAEILWHVIDMTPEEVIASAAAKDAQQVRRFADPVQKSLDTFAKTRGYDGIMSACTYVTSSNPKFAAEAAYCVSLRDATWTACYTILDEVKVGTRPIPTVPELLALMPVPAWPA